MAAAMRLSGYFLTVYLLANIAASEGGSQDPGWNATSVEKKQGDRFSVKCTIPNTRRFEVFRLVKQNEAEDQLVTISDNDDIKSPFKETHRYDVSLSRLADEKKTEIVLSYVGIRGEDAGRIGCRTLRQGSKNVWVDIKVLVPVKDLYIAHQVKDEPEIPVQDGDVVVMREKQEEQVLCVAKVNGSMVPPQMTVTIGGDDKTSVFTPKEDATTMPNGGLPYHFSEMKLVYDNLKPDANFNGKTLTCTARREGFRDRTVSAVIAVEYTPIITCHKYKRYGVIGKSITLACEVQSNPRGEIYWTWGEEQTKLNSGQLDAPNNMEATEQMLNRTDKLKVNLKISKINEAHLGTYTLTAKNDYDETDVTLELIQGHAKPKPNPEPEPANPAAEESKEEPKPEEVTGGASRWSADWLTIVVSLFAGLVQIAVSNR